MSGGKNFAAKVLLVVGLLVWTGCKENRTETPKPGDSKPAAKAGGEEGHSHERGKMLVADVGRKYHALLTAHLSPKGNELDLFFETTDDKNPTPVAIPVDSFTAHLRGEGHDEPKQVIFEPAPAAERPKGEKPGTCSHFVAKVPWMKATDTLSVVVLLNLGNERFRVAWKNFNPKKYAHHEE
jgi:hypothetical protein